MDYTYGLQNRRISQPTVEDWEACREIITKLYIDDNMSLTRLVTYMRDHYRFHASVNMFKTRFKDWQVWKNTTAKRIVPSMQQGITFTRHDQLKRRQEYFRRLPANRRQQFIDSLENYQSSLLPIRVATSLSPPADLHTSEFYTHQLRALVKGSSDAKLWPRDEQGSFLNEGTVPIWCSSVKSACWLLSEGKVADGYRFLRMFIDESPGQLSRQDPLLFPFIFTSVLSFATGHPRIAKHLIRAIYCVSQTLDWADQSHPLRLMIERMARCEPESIQAHASTIILTYIDLIKETLGAAYPIVQDMLSDAIFRLLTHNLMGTPEIISLGRRMILEAEASKYDRCKDYFSLKLSLANAHLSLNETNQAHQLGWEIWNNEHTNRRMLVSVCMTMSRISEAESREDEAVEWALRGIVKSVEVFGDSSDWFLDALMFHRQLLARLRRFEDAERVAQDRDLIIEKICNGINQL